VIAAALVGLGCAACGARLPGEVHQQAAAAALSPRHGGSVQQPAAGNGTPGAVAPTQLPTAGGGPTAPSGRGSAPAVDNGPTIGPSARSNEEAPTCSGGTDVGLTSTTLTLGEVVTLSGPVSGLFQGAVQGGEAFANFVNSTSGGICGRQVKVTIADDGTNCTQNENATQSLAGRAFALVGSFALYDGCGASIIRSRPELADIHVALDPAADTPGNHFDISSKEGGYGTGPFRYFKQKYGAKLDHVGTIVENIPSAVAKQKAQVRAAESQGWHFTDSILEQPTNSNFISDFQRLCGRDHITAFFELTEPASNAATMMQNERQAGCPKDLLNIIPISYDQAFISDYQGPKSDLDGIQGYNQYALFFNADEAAANPEVKLFQEWFRRTYGNQPMNLYAMFAWASDRLFQQAAEAVHGPLTRKALMASLRKIHSFSDGGLIAPTDPQAGGPHCYIVYQIRSGGFERVGGPKTGYRCDGRFLPAPGS
jgi:hypothetical protein